MVIAGPITNPANGHQYYLLDAKGWLASEAEAASLGGHLATVDDAAEDAWIASTFFPLASGDGNLWIGLNDAGSEGNFSWSSSSPAAYRNWATAQPDNLGGNEHYTHVFGPGRPESPAWNDFNEAGSAPTLTTPHGVVEVVPAAIPALGGWAWALLVLLVVATLWWRQGARQAA